MYTNLDQDGWIITLFLLYLFFLTYFLVCHIFVVSSSLLLFFFSSRQLLQPFLGTVTRTKEGSRECWKWLTTTKTWWSTSRIAELIMWVQFGNKWKARCRAATLKLWRLLHPHDWIRSCGGGGGGGGYAQRFKVTPELESVIFWREASSEHHQAG